MNAAIRCGNPGRTDRIQRTTMESLNLNPQPEPVGPNPDDIATAKSGAAWFYWIAGLSIVNTMIFYFGGSMAFFAGLGITQLIDAIVAQISLSGEFPVVRVIAVVIDVLIAGFFLLVGLWASKLNLVAFAVGIVLYVLDGLLVLVLGAYFEAGFHVLALFFIVRGLLAARRAGAATGV